MESFFGEDQRKSKCECANGRVFSVEELRD
jgi:hypothetical protein